MRIKKILSLAVVLAMVMAVVPMFGLTASAAATAPKDLSITFLNMLAEKGTVVFDDSADKNYNDSPVTDWSGWKSDFGYNTNVGKNKGNYANLKTYDGLNVLQFFKSNGGSGGNNIYTSSDVFTKTKGTDYFILEFTTSGNNTKENNFTFYDVNSESDRKDNHIFLKFFYDANGIKPHTLATQEGDNFESTALPGTNKAGTRVRAYVVKNSEDTYSVIWTVNDAGRGGFWVKAANEVKGMVADKRDNGFGIWRDYAAGKDGEWNYIGFGDVKIYAGNYEDIGEDTINAAALAGTIEIDPIVSGDVTLSKSVSSNSLNGTVEWQSSNPEIISTEGKFTAPVETTNVTLTATVSSGNAKIEKTFTVFATPDSRKGGSYEFNGVNFTIDSKNLVTNGDFQSDMDGWTGGSTETEVTNWDIDETYGVHGKAAVRNASASGGAASASTIRRYVEVQPGKSYYVSYYVYSTAYNSGEYTAAVGTTENFFGDWSAKEAPKKNLILNPGDFGGHSNWDKGEVVVGFGSGDGADTTETHNFGLKKYEYIIYAPAGFTDEKYTGNYIMLAFGGWSTPNVNYYSDIEVYEATPAKGHAKLTVNFKDDKSEVILPATEKYDDIRTYVPYTYDARSITAANEDYTIVKAPEKDSYEVNEQIDGSATIEITLVDNFADIAPAKSYSVNNAAYTTTGENLVPNPSFERKDGTFTSAGWYSPSSESIANNKPYPAAHRYDADTKHTDGSHAFGSRYGDDWKGTCSILNNFKVEAGKTYYFAFDVMPNGDSHSSSAEASTGFVSGAQKAPVAESGEAKKKTDLDALTANQWHTVATIIEVPEDKDDPYIQFNAHGIGRSGNSNPGEPQSVDGDEVAPFLFDNFMLVEVEPVETIATDTKLGYNGTKLSVDFVLAKALTDGYSVDITSGDKLVENVTKGALGENTVISVVPGDSNTIYTATLKYNDVVAGAPVNASLYSEVVENIASEAYADQDGEFPEKMLALANDVISKGGVYYEDPTKINAQTDTIVNVTKAEDDTVTIEIDPNYVKFGIGFILSGNDVVIGSETKEVSNADQGKVYQSLTVSATGDVTLEAIDGTVVTLDSVNIEFVETLIEEFEASGADAEMDFVPEL